MLNANLYVAERKAAKQQSQDKKLFSDIAIGAFKRCTHRSLQGGLHQVFKLKLTYRMSDSVAE